MADNITRIEGDSTSPTGMIGSMQGTPSTSASTPGSMSVDMSSTVAGMVEKGLGIAMGIAEIGTGVPGGTAAISGAVTDTVRGKAPEDIGVRAASTVGKSALNQAGVLAPVSGYVVNTAKNVLDESKRGNYANYGYAATKAAPGAVGALAGMAVGGPIGGFVGGILGAMLGANSLESGFLGDKLGSRTHEMNRDALAGQGYGYGDIAGIVANDIDMQSGFTPNARGTSQGTFSNPNVSNNTGMNVDTPSNNGVASATANNPHEQNDSGYGTSHAEQTANNPHEQIEVKPDGVIGQMQDKESLVRRAAEGDESAIEEMRLSDARSQLNADAQGRSIMGKLKEFSNWSSGKASDGKPIVSGLAARDLAKRAGLPPEAAEKLVMPEYIELAYAIDEALNSGDKELLEKLLKEL